MTRMIDPSLARLGQLQSILQSSDESRTTILFSTASTKPNTILSTGTAGDVSSLASASLMLRMVLLQFTLTQVLLPVRETTSIQNGRLRPFAKTLSWASSSRRSCRRAYQRAWVNKILDACMDGWMDGWMHGCMDAWMDGCMHGWMHAETFPAKPLPVWVILFKKFTLQEALYSKHSLSTAPGTGILVESLRPKFIDPVFLTLRSLRMRARASALARATDLTRPLNLRTTARAILATHSSQPEMESIRLGLSPPCSS